MQSIKKHSRMLIGTVIGVVLGGGLATAAFASIPDSNGKIHACYSNLTGATRLTNSPTASCRGGETAISWDQSAGPGRLLSLVGASLDAVSFEYRDLSGVDMHGSELLGAWKGTNLSGANLSNTSYNMTGFVNGTNLTGANLTGSTFLEASFAFGANLTNANFGDTNITSTSFDSTYGAVIVAGTNFTNAHFVNSTLTGTNFTGAILTGATWSATTCPDGTNSDSDGNTCIGHLVP
jgi:uncharacterized protein YjbI with pentapeptide repeats